MSDRDLSTFIRILFGSIEAIKERLNRLEGHETATGADVEGVHNATYPVTDTSILAGTTVYSDVIPGSFGTPANVKGVWLSVRGESDGIGFIAFESADETPDMFSSLVTFPALGVYGSLCMVRLGSVTIPGQIAIKAITANFIHIYASVVGYWT